MDVFTELKWTEHLHHVHIFVSHTEEDSRYARGLIKTIQDAEMSPFSFVFTPTPLGDDFPTRVHDAIQESQFVVVLWSKNAASSDWVRKEIAYAQELSKNIVPVLLEDDIELPEPLKRIQSVQAYRDPSGWPLQIKNHIRNVCRAAFEDAQERERRKRRNRGIAKFVGKWFLLGTIGWLLGREVEGAGDSKAKERPDDRDS